MSFITTITPGLRPFVDFIANKAISDTLGSIGQITPLGNGAKFSIFSGLNFIGGIPGWSGGNGIAWAGRQGAAEADAFIQKNKTNAADQFSLEKSISFSARTFTAESAAVGTRGGPSTAILVMMAMMALAQFAGIMVKEFSDRVRERLDKAKQILEEQKALRKESARLQDSIDQTTAQKQSAVTAAGAAGSVFGPACGQAAAQAAAVPFDRELNKLNSQKRVIDNKITDNEGQLKLMGDLNQADSFDLKYWDNLHNQAWQIANGAHDGMKNTVNQIAQGLGR